MLNGVMRKIYNPETYPLFGSRVQISNKLITNLAFSVLGMGSMYLANKYGYVDLDKIDKEFNVAIWNKCNKEEKLYSSIDAGLGFVDKKHVLPNPNCVENLRKYVSMSLGFFGGYIFSISLSMLDLYISQIADALEFLKEEQN